MSSLLQLSTLDVSHNQVSDLGPLSEMSNLSYLYVSHNLISDLGTLTGLLNLSRLDVWNNPLKILPFWITESEFKIKAYHLKQGRHG